MKKGTVAKALVNKPFTGKKDTSKPAGPGKRFFGYVTAGKKGKKAK